MILIANIGSASKKYALYDGEKEVLASHYEEGQEDYPWAREVFVERAKEHGTISAVGIRVVAPGAYFQKHRRIDKEYLKHLAAAQDFAPLHITATLAEIRALQAALPHLPFIGASDSAFHATMPEVARTYALPQELIKKFNLYRFGYHGLSLESIASQLHSAGAIPEKTIVCHLGSGSSVTALKNGASIETSMGFSPLEGLVMATRSGSVDPTVISLLFEKSGLSPSELEKKLNTKSGLLAVGESNDVRILLAREKTGDAKATLALDLFAHQVRKHIGSCSATLGGVDALVFTGTIGERSEPMRSRILKGLDFLIAPDVVSVLHTDETRVIARVTQKLA